VVAAVRLPVEEEPIASIGEVAGAQTFARVGLSPSDWGSAH
jgi:hypothetical protein